MQPVSVVLDRYKRMIHDVAQLKDKQVDVRVVGEDVQIDKFVLDAIAEPLGRLLRDVVSNSIEPAADRLAAGKPEAGVLEVHTENHDTHIAISIQHDGTSRDTDEIRAEAEAFDAAPSTIGTLSDDEVQLLPLHAWFETSETAGVIEAFAQQRATVVAHSRADRTGYTITPPIAGAVIGVMSVEVGESIYAIPVNAIREIVNLRTYPAQQVGGRPVLRIRDGLYPLMPCAAWFDDEPVSEPRFAVIVHADGAAAALGVDRVLGHQEIVIEPVGLPDEHVGPFLGAAIRGGGEVCLVIDVRQAIANQGTSASAQAA